MRRRNKRNPQSPPSRIDGDHKIEKIHYKKEVLSLIQRFRRRRIFPDAFFLIPVIFLGGGGGGGGGGKILELFCHQIFKIFLTKLKRGATTFLLRGRMLVFGKSDSSWKKYNFTKL